MATASTTRQVTAKRRALDAVEDRYDVILLDCRAGTEIPTLACTIAATSIVGATQAGLKELRNTISLQDYVTDIADGHERPLRLVGILPCAVPASGRAYAEAIDLARELFGDLLLPPVRRSVAVTEAHAARLPYARWKPSSSCDAPEDCRAGRWSRPRIEYGAMVVFLPLFCDQSINTLFRRSVFAIRDTTSSGMAFSTCSATRRAHSDAWPEVISASIGTYRCKPFEPDVTGTVRSPRPSRRSRRYSATRAHSARPAPGPGSRSNTTRSGCRSVDVDVTPEGPGRGRDPPLRHVQLQGADLAQPTQPGG